MDRFGGEEYDQSGDLVPVLASVECKYRFPLTYPDDILIGVGVRDIGEDRFIQTYGVYSLGHRVVAAEGHGRLVYFDRAQGGKAPIPPKFKQRLLEMAGE
jgi:acyl-CoA thioester hydrolase